MTRWLRFVTPWHRPGLALWLGLLACGLAGYFFWLSRPNEAVLKLSLTTGRIVTPPKRITELFLQRTPEYGLTIGLVDVDGSEDTLDKIEEGKIEVGVVKGGIALGQRHDIRQVTALDIESFHLLVRAELYEAATRDFAALRGKRINVNRPATGTHHWALDILQFAGLRPKHGQDDGNFIPTELGNPELLQQLALIESAHGKDKERLIAELPDAVLLAEPIPSPIARRFCETAHYQLLSIPFGPAYIQYRHAAPPNQYLDSAVLIELTSIPIYSYGASPPVPAQECGTIGLRRLLVAHKDVPIQKIVRCLRLLYDHPAHPALELLDWAKVQPEYPLHDGVAAYDFERKHVLQNTVVRLFERLGSVLGGIVGLILAIYGYIRYRRLLRFEHYFHEIRSIDLIGRGKLTDPAAPTDRAQLLAYLQNRLAELRTSAIAEFAQGRLQGESLILSIFTLIQDTNFYLAGLLGNVPTPK